MCDSIFLPSGLKVTGDFVYGKLDFILKKYAGFVVLKKKNWMANPIHILIQVRKVISVLWFYPNTLIPMSGVIK